MPTFSGRTALGIGAGVANVLIGSVYQNMPFDGTIEVGINANNNLVTCDVSSGPDILAQAGSIVPFVVATEKMPVYPDDFHWEDEAAQGDLLKIGLQNTNAAAVVVHWSIRITPA